MPNTPHSSRPSRRWRGRRRRARAKPHGSNGTGGPRTHPAQSAGCFTPPWRQGRRYPGRMSVNAPVQIDRQRIRELIEREEKRLNDATPKSAATYKRAHEVLSGGVASSYQLRDPWPIYLEKGAGPRVRDVDGNEYLDFHNGFGSMVQGHAHPAIGRALQERYAGGTHFAAPTEDAIVVAEELQRRWGGLENLASLPYGAGIPQATVEMTVAVPFNDAGAMERRIERLTAEGRKPACVIMEAAMMNLGVVLPADGYLEQVRDICTRHGVVLIFDEVKTGLCIAPGGATERFGVMPDMVTLAKALGGGVPTGAIGGNEEVISVVEDGSVFQVGTYNGNPLGMAASRANLLEVLTDDAYTHLDALNDRIVRGCQGVVEKHNLPGYAVGVGSKGCVTFSPEKIVDYETFKANQDADLAELAWLFNMNRGIFMTPGREEEWTLSVTHTDESVDAYVRVFES